MMLIVIFFLVTAVEVWATIMALEHYFGIVCSTVFGMLIAAAAFITNGVLFWFYLHLKKHSSGNNR